MIDVFGVEFVPESDDAWLDALRNVTKEAFREAGADPDEDEELFDYIRFDVVEDTVLGWLNTKMYEFVGRAKDAALDAVMEALK